jgi:hypothetical protein
MLELSAIFSALAKNPAFNNGCKGTSFKFGDSPVMWKSHADALCKRFFPVTHAYGIMINVPPGLKTRKVSLSVHGSRIYSDGKVETT